MFWLFSACTPSEDLGTVDQSVDQVVLIEDVPTEDVPKGSSEAAPSSGKKVPPQLQNEDAKLIQQHQSRDFTHPSAPSDEHNALHNQNRQSDSPVTATAAVTTTTPPTSGSGSSDDATPTPAEPLGAFSQFFHSQCVQECAEGAGELADGDDSFLAVFDNQNFVAADRGGLYEATYHDVDHRPTPRLSLKGMTVRVHAPRQILPMTGYEVQWQVDPPQFTGLYRVQATVVRERFETQYACSETGRPIEVHQEGERLEVARLTCYRMRPRILRQHYDTSWKQKYPEVAKFLQAVPEGPNVESYYQPRGMIKSVTQLLLQDLYVHPDYRGGGLGLSLIDHACRKVGDALASIVLGLPPSSQSQPSSSRRDDCLKMEAPHDEPHCVESRSQEQDEEEGEDDEDTVNPEARALEHYFGLLGFVHIHQDYMARAMGRVLLEEACPCAPQLDPNRIETY